MSERERGWEDFTVWRTADIRKGGSPECMYTARVRPGDSAEEVAAGLRTGCDAQMLEAIGGAEKVAAEWVARTKELHS